MHAHPDHTRSCARSREAGFSVAELIIAMAILTILTIIAMMSFNGAKRSSRVDETKAVGSAYMQAISQYHADHANRHPTTPAGDNSAAVKAGPLNLLNRPYLSPMPEAVSDGRVGVSIRGGNCGNAKATPSGAGAATATGWVSVCYAAEPRYSVRVLARSSSGASWADASATMCWLGIVPGGGTRC